MRAIAIVDGLTLEPPEGKMGACLRDERLPYDPLYLVLSTASLLKLRDALTHLLDAIASASQAESNSKGEAR